MRLPYIRHRFFSEIGVAIVVLAAVGAAVASAVSITAYLDESGSWCGTVRREIQAGIGIWAPSLSLLSVAGLGLSSMHQLCPRLCRIGVAVTLLLSAAAVVVAGVR